MRFPGYRDLRSERGQAVVEMAMILPVLVLLIFGSLELGRALNAWIVVTEAAREGARVAAVRCTVTNSCGSLVGTAVTNSLAGLDVASSSWSMTPGPYQSGNTVRVNVVYQVPIVVPLISNLIGGNSISVAGETTMRLE